MKITIGKETFEYESPNFEKALRDAYKEFKPKHPEVSFKDFVNFIMKKGLITYARELSFSEAFKPMIAAMLGKNPDELEIEHIGGSDGTFTHGPQPSEEQEHEPDREHDEQQTHTA